MRRTALFFAGAVVATGAAMAFAGPASAATTHTAGGCSALYPSLYSYCSSYNPQYLNQQAYTSQTAISNSNNPQFGLVNANIGNGGASNSSITSISGWLG